MTSKDNFPIEDIYNPLNQNTNDNSSFVNTDTTGNGNSRSSFDLEDVSKGIGVRKEFFNKSIQNIPKTKGNS